MFEVENSKFIGLASNTLNYYISKGEIAEDDPVAINLRKAINYLSKAGLIGFSSLCLELYFPLVILKQVNPYTEHLIIPDFISVFGPGAFNGSEATVIDLQCDMGNLNHKFSGIDPRAEKLTVRTKAPVTFANNAFSLCKLKELDLRDVDFRELQEARDMFIQRFYPTTVIFGKGQLEYLKQKKESIYEDIMASLRGCNVIEA